jgi:hypothetical protein
MAVDQVVCGDSTLRLAGQPMDADQRLLAERICDLASQLELTL